MLQGMPKPASDYDTESFWNGIQEKRFLIQKCSECGEIRWPPGPMCSNCQSEQFEEFPASTEGRVYSWCVVHHPAHPALADQVPYVAAVVELTDGVRVVGNILGVDPSEIEADMPVTMVFEHGDGYVLYNFSADSGVQ